MRGKPEIPIDFEELDALLACGCIGTEIAAYFGVAPDTLYIRIGKHFNKTFSAYAAEKRAVGDALLKKVQYEKALGISKKGDNTLLIWLGKQRLGQKENAAELIVPEELKKPFEDLMNQLAEIQGQSKPNEEKMVDKDPSHLELS